MKTKAAILLIIVGIVLFIGQLISVSEYSTALRCGLAGIPFYIGTIILLFDKEKKQNKTTTADDKAAALKKEKKRIKKAKKKNSKISKLLDPHKIAIVLVIIGLVFLFIQLITRSEISMILRCTVASIPAIIGIMIFAIVPEQQSKNLNDKIESDKTKVIAETNKEDKKVEKQVEDKKVQNKPTIQPTIKREAAIRKPVPVRASYSGTKPDVSKPLQRTKPVEPLKTTSNTVKKEEESDFRKELAAKIEARIAAKREKLNKEKELKKAAN